MKARRMLAVLMSLAMVFTMMPMMGTAVYAADDTDEPVVVHAGNHADVGNVTIVNRGKAVEVHGSDGQTASAKVNGNVEITNANIDPTSIGVIARADTKGSASVDVSGNVLVAAPDSAVGINSAAEKELDYAEVNVVGDVTTLSPGGTAQGINTEDGNVTVGGNVSASGNKYAVGVATMSENQASRIIIKGGLSALSPEGIAQGINAQDGNVTVGGNVSANGCELAMGVAATSQNYPSSIIIKGGLSAEGIGVQAATISAADKTGDLTFVVGKGGITAVSKGDMGDIPIIVPLSTGLTVGDGSGKLIADIQGDIKAQSDMKRSTAILIGIGHGENHGDDPQGTQDVRVHGNLISDDRGIMFIESDFSVPSVTDVLVENEIKADNVGILVYKHHADLLTGGVRPTNRLNLNVWKIKLNENGNVAEYYTDNVDQVLPEGISPTGVDRDFEKKINYIIKTEKPAGGNFKALYANGKALSKSHGYDVAHEGEKVILKADAGYQITAAYNGKDKKVALKKDEKGNYYINVPKGGGVYLSAEVKKAAAEVSGTATAKMTAKGSRSLVIAWDKINGADGYDIFFSQCNHSGKELVCRNVKTIKGNKTFKWTKSGLKKGTAYKAYVKAYVMKNGKKKYVKTSPMVHAYTGNGNKRFTNAKSVTVKKSSLSLKTGKSYKIKASVVKVSRKKKLMSSGHAPTLRYMTSDRKVATVSKSGKVTAKGTGTCTIYVYAHNGVSKKIKVTVK